jgi:4-hydroxy-tetrahydrodipicolinate synthase
MESKECRKMAIRRIRKKHTAKAQKDDFSGLYTAIVTPFKNDGSVDYGKLRELIEFQIENGVSGIVPCGTTGESPTLSHDEHEKVIKETVRIVDGRAKVIAGAGSNSTQEAISLSKKAETFGADAILSVSPYYNKPTQEGLYRHFNAICESVSIPVILYNIKGRTGVNIETPTLLRLIKDCKNLAGVKEASGDLNQIRDVIRRTPERFFVLAGDDGIAVEVIRSGGDGLISVASNLMPKEMSEMIGSALAGDMKHAEAMNKRLSAFFRAEFIETNPIPIKAALAMQGKINEVYRLPLCEMGIEHKRGLRRVMKELGVL